MLGHTRWASVGIISEANAHPLNQEERGAADGGAYVTAALNGDVDNFAELVALHELAIPPEITTDAKVIPALVRRRIDAGEDVTEAFRATVAAFEGSVAIGAHAGADARPGDARAPGQRPGALRRARRRLLRRRERAVRPGRGDVARTCASTVRRPANPDNPGASRGQIVVLDADRRRARSTASSASPTTAPSLPVADDELVTPQITTRDIDRGDFPHYLLKEISEAPASFRKTLRGKIIERDGVPGRRAARTRRSPRTCGRGCAPASSAGCS